MVDHVLIITLSLVLHLLSLESLLLFISLWNVALFVRMVYLSDDHCIWQVGEVPISPSNALLPLAQSVLLCAVDFMIHLCES